MNKKNYQNVSETCQKYGAQLVAVSKTRTTEQILEMYQVGQKVFGENRVQELLEKHDKLPSDIQWHLIGHLQSNKVKYIAPFVSMIHSVDSLNLLEEINKQANKNARIIDCLLQFHIAEETTKYGLDIDEASTLLKSDSFAKLENINIVGVMGMATFTDNEKQIAQEFKNLKSIFAQLKNDFFSEKETFKEISMGMSSDFEIALKEGSTMVRVGSLIF